jgi:hypothetical protein
MPQLNSGEWPNTATKGITGANTPVAGGLYVTAQNPFASVGPNLPAATPFTNSNAYLFYASPYFKTPYSEQYNLGFEQGFWKSSVVAVNYVGSVTRRMDSPGMYNTGTPSATLGTFATRFVNGTTGAPFPYAYPVRSWDHNAASASYNALQVALRGHYGPGFSYMASYTWSKVLDEGSDGFFGYEGGQAQDPYNPRGSRGPAGFNIPQVLVADAEYAIPVGKGKSFSTGSKYGDYVLGNWQLNAILTGRSGQNFNVVAAGDIGNTGQIQTHERANLVGNPYQSGTVAANPTCVAPAGPTRTRKQWFNPCAFETPAAGTLGDAGRNFMQDQNFWNLDASVFRIVPIHNDFRMKLDLEAFNALNHPVLGTPGAATTSPASLGVVTAIQTGNAQRIMQISVKLLW